MWHAGSSVFIEACRLFSCSMWDPVLGPEVEPGLPAWGAWNLSRWTTREVTSIVSHASLMRKQPAQRAPLVQVVDWIVGFPNGVMGFPGGSKVKKPPANAGRQKRPGLNPWVGKIPWRRKWQPTPVFLPGKSQGQRSLAGYNPWGHKRFRYHLATNNK